MRFALASLFSLVVLGIACGGSTESDGTDSGTQGGSGGSSAGSGTSGSGTAGSGTSGSGTAGSGTAGSGTSGSGTAGSSPASWALCGVPGDCTLDWKGCCWTCSPPTAADLDAVNKTKLAEHKADVCKDPSPGCPKCATQPNPALIAVCALGPGQCSVLDLSTTDFTACGGDGDCTLRYQDCCECGATGPVTAIAKSMAGAFSSLVCAPNQACAECGATYPSNLAAKCVVGHCAAVAQ